MKEQVIQNILTHKLIAIVRGVYGEDCLRLAQALYAGGIRLLEVTFDQAKPEDHIKTADTIRQDYVNILDERTVSYFVIRDIILYILNTAVISDNDIVQSCESNT